MAPSDAEQRDQSQTRPLVLVVEDEPSMLEILMVNLEASGYEVLGAGDGLEGWRLFEEREPDLVVLDLNLPTISGFRLLELFRGASDRPDVPVLALTALDFAEAEELVKLGLDGFISKPFDPRELVNTVKHLLARRDPGSA
jgi:DNA-binding response OmpR family regulator